MRRKKERSKQGQTNKQGKVTQHTQGSHVHVQLLAPFPSYPHSLSSLFPLSLSSLNPLSTLSTLPLLSPHSLSTRSGPTCVRCSRSWLTCRLGSTRTQPRNSSSRKMWICAPRNWRGVPSLNCFTTIYIHECGARES